jgi:hypothetical protein
VAGNPRRNALFGVVSETFGLQGLGGGVRSQIRTGLRTNSRLLGKINGNMPNLAGSTQWVDEMSHSFRRFYG